MDLWKVRGLFDSMPVRHLLWEPFEVFYSKAVLPVAKRDEFFFWNRSSKQRKSK